MKAEYFPVKLAHFLKTPLEHDNNFVEHRRAAAPVKCLSFESFCQAGDDFFMAMRFSKESMKINNVSNFDMRHELRMKRYYYYSRLLF